MSGRGRARRTILLTGGSGVIGSALLPELDGHRVICLVHRAQPEGVEFLEGDVTRARLGLSAAEYARLADEVDCVVHAAAVTDWPAPKEELTAVNVGGTRRVLAFARDADAPLYWVSTAFVRALSPAAAVELDESNVIVEYVRTKLACEELMRETDVPHATFRPTNVLGDSRTGWIAKPQAPQIVADLVCRGRLPLFPARPDGRIDVIPQDVVARAVAAALDADDIGSEYWITAGPEALTSAQLLDICESFMARIGRPIERPRIVHPDEAAAADLSPVMRLFFQRALEMSEAQAACGLLPSSLDDLRARYEMPDFTLSGAFERGLEFWARSRDLLPAPVAR